jgi:1-acyl-sn-glycerol-3-phosphate acyltransferase
MILPEGRRRDMSHPTRRGLPGALLAAMAAAALGCAHTAAVESAAPPVPEKVVVTGSHIPQLVDLRSGLPATTSPVHVHTRDEVVQTGRPGLAAALRQLEPGAR